MGGKTKNHKTELFGHRVPHQQKRETKKREKGGTIKSPMGQKTRGGTFVGVETGTTGKK